MKRAITITIILSILIGCQNNESKDNSKYSMAVKHYYSLVMDGDMAKKDTLKNCFSCNQATVKDGNGKEVERRFYYANMEDMYAYELFIHNDKNQKTGSNYYEKDTLVNNYRYVLDETGRILEGRAYDAITDTMKYGYINSYDTAGNHTRTAGLDSKGQVVDSYVRTFNENGVAVTENIEDVDGNVTFRVKYDYRPKADSNWIEQLTYYNDVLKEIRFKEEIPVDELIKQ